MVVADQPPFVRLALPDHLAKILVARLVQKAKAVRPVIKTQLQRSLAREPVGEILANFCLRDGQALDAKGQEAFAPFANRCARSGFRRAVAILGIFHLGQERPAGGRGGNDLLEQKIRHNAGKVRIHIDLEAVLVLVGEQVAAIKWIGKLEPLTVHVMGQQGPDTEGIELQ